MQLIASYVLCRNYGREGDSFHKTSRHIEGHNIKSYEYTCFGETVVDEVIGSIRLSNISKVAILSPMNIRALAKLWLMK